MVQNSTPAPAIRRGAAREKLLDAAERLFYAHGVAATGIDAITAEAGVAKKSLYNNFASKADLITAYLEHRHVVLIELYRVRLRAAGSPRDRVLAMFDAYLDHAALAWADDFRGCGLLNAAAELPSGHPGRLAVSGHKEEIQDLLAVQLSELLPGDPGRVSLLAGHLSFLLEGSMVRAGLDGSDARLRQARALAANLLAEA